MLYGSESLEELSERCLARREHRAQGWRRTGLAAASVVGALGLVGALVLGVFT